MSVPMVDLKIQYDTLKAEIDAAISDVLQSTAFILGPQGKALEQAVGAYHGVKFAVGVASGTDALHLALRAADIRPGDEVITTPFTFIATAEALSYIGVVPVFADIRPDTFNLDVSQIEARITKRTRALLPVHLYGQPADMGPLMEIARKHRLKVIEDCAQSFGADYRGRKTGSFGEFGCFSFFPSKNLGCYGDGGMVITDDAALAERLQSLRNHGSKVRYYHDEIGYNSRLDEVQAAVLNVKFKRFDAFNADRRKNAARYNKLLAVPGSDETKTLILGRPDARQKKVYDLVRRAQARAIRAIRPGVSVRSIDRAAREVISRAGYGHFFGHGTGHGIGLAVHEAPTLSPRGSGGGRGGDGLQRGTGSLPSRMGRGSPGRLGLGD